MKIAQHFPGFSFGVAVMFAAFGLWRMIELGSPPVSALTVCKPELQPVPDPGAPLTVKSGRTTFQLELQQVRRDSAGQYQQREISLEVLLPLLHQPEKTFCRVDDRGLILTVTYEPRPGLVHDWSFCTELKTLEEIQDVMRRDADRLPQ